VLEEDLHTKFHRLLLKYCLGQGLAMKQKLLYISAESNPFYQTLYRLPKNLDLESTGASSTIASATDDIDSHSDLQQNHEKSSSKVVEGDGGGGGGGT